MNLSAKWLIYIATAIALVVGVAAYSLSELEHDHEEAGLIEGDIARVAIIGAVLAVVAVISFMYLAKKPPEGA